MNNFWRKVLEGKAKLFLELITKYSKGKIIILSEEDKIEPEEELVKDVMSIMNVYVAKMNGLRKYKKLSKKE
jgi:predicted site-specific integrase-resolvase